MSTEAKARHTPGPWNTNLGVVWPGDSSGNPIAYLNGHCRKLAEDEANARLIAAAPDLLEALKEIMDFIGEKDDSCKEGPNCVTCSLADAGRAAITKAEGGAL